MTHNHPLKEECKHEKKELTIINKAIKYAISEIKQWEKWVKQLEERKKELSNKKLK